MDKILCLIFRYEPITNLLIAAIPIVLTVLGSYIAIQQYRTNKKKLKLDLFDKRFLIFQATKDYLAEVIISVPTSLEEQSKFLRGTRGAEYVFSKDIKKYIDEIWAKSIDLEEWAQDPGTALHAQERASHIKWFKKELENVDTKFRKYMQLSH